MKFKQATIDIRMSRLAGQNERGLFEPGRTYSPRYVQQILPGMPVKLIDSIYPTYAVLEIRDWFDNPIDGEIFINSRFAYAFEIDGIVSTTYQKIEFYYEGFNWILELRFVARENS